MTKQHEVVVTGIGLVTPLGNDTQTTWRNAIAGKSGIVALQSDEYAQQPHAMAGLVRGEQEALDHLVNAKDQARSHRFMHLGLLAAHQALTDAALLDADQAVRDHIGVYMGVSVGALDVICQSALQADKDGHHRRVSPFALPKAITNMAPAWVSMQWGLKGPVLAFANACSSSSDALGFAFRAVRDGYAPYMLAGGSESCITPLTLAGFYNMRALSRWPGAPEQASRPFDQKRCGFVIAEGAAMLMLERAESAYARGATIYGTIKGYGATSDAFHMTAMQPDGLGAQRAVLQALDQAGLQPTDIGYVNAHGTSTPMNDATESKMFKRVFGTYADPEQKNHVRVSSTKSMTGHMLGAAGAAEAAFCLLALHNGVLPPTINLDTPDSACELDYIANAACTLSVEHALSTSFGFGGGNAALVFGRGN